MRTQSFWIGDGSGMGLLKPGGCAQPIIINDFYDVLLKRYCSRKRLQGLPFCRQHMKRYPERLRKYDLQREENNDKAKWLKELEGE